MYQNIILLYVNVSWDELVGIFIVGVEREVNGRPGGGRGELAGEGLSSSCNLGQGVVVVTTLMVRHHQDHLYC